MTSVTATTLAEYQITTFITGGTWKQNCYLVRHTPTGAMFVVDPGGDDAAIIDAIRCRGDTLSYILLTHGHHDHLGAAASLARAFSVRCRVHRADVRLLLRAPMYALRFAGRRIEVPTYAVHDTPADYALGGQRIQIVETPGHTAGSVCYALSGMVFTGDTLLFRCAGRTDLPGADPTVIAASIRRLTDQFAGETVLLPGHGRSWTVAEAKQWWDSRAPKDLPKTCNSTTE
jgi:hydroxyacylglutathione hydrolase